MTTPSPGQATQLKKRFRPAKIVVKKSLYEDLKKQSPSAVAEILRLVEEFQDKPPRSTAAEGMAYRECLDLLNGLGTLDKVILPDHGKSGMSIGRFVQQLAVLGVTAEDIERMADQMLRWKTPMSLEKFTAILPSMVTEARSLKQSNRPAWRPPVWGEVVDGTGESDF